MRLYSRTAFSSLLRTLIPAQLALRRIQNDQYRNKGRDLEGTGGTSLTPILLKDKTKFSHEKHRDVVYLFLVESCIWSGPRCWQGL